VAEMWHGVTDMWHGVTDMWHCVTDPSHIFQTTSKSMLCCFLKLFVLMAGGKRSNPSANWDEGDEEVLIDFLQGSLSAAGDGINF
jgi:hypothetical protein